MSDNKSFYRQSASANKQNHTYVSEMYRNASDEINWEETGNHVESEKAEERVINLQNRQIIGVLYSVSAGSKGEIFPIYLGRNVIGRDSSCDICLREGSVAMNHALLLARKDYDEEGNEIINLTITDNNSIYGSGLNDFNLSEKKTKCDTGDVLSIGYNYRLLVSLFNSHGKLGIARNFEPIAEEKPDESVNTYLPAPEPPVPATVNHEASAVGITEEPDNSTKEFYKPTLKPNTDHSSNNTIIL